jgi:hypothetical protein
MNSPSVRLDDFKYALATLRHVLLGDFPAFIALMIDQPPIARRRVFADGQADVLRVRQVQLHLWRGQTGCRSSGRSANQKKNWKFNWSLRFRADVFVDVPNAGAPSRRTGIPNSG